MGNDQSGNSSKADREADSELNRRVKRLREALESGVTDPHGLAEGDGTQHNSLRNVDYRENTPPHHGS